MHGTAPTELRTRSAQRLPLAVRQVYTQTGTTMSPAKASDDARKQSIATEDGTASGYVKILILQELLKTQQRWCNLSCQLTTIYLLRTAPCIFPATSRAFAVSLTFCRKLTAPKAWTTGTNPITQRASPSSSVNGIANGHVQEQAKANGKGNQSADKHAHDRLMFLYSNFVVRTIYECLLEHLLTLLREWIRCSL